MSSNWSPEDYPRDMVGYARKPPQAGWPGGARIAIQFVINYEEGGENSILHGDEASEAFLSEIVGGVPWPGQRHMNMESIYEYGSRAGFWRLWRLDRRGQGQGPAQDLDVQSRDDAAEDGGIGRIKSGLQSLPIPVGV